MSNYSPQKIFKSHYLKKEISFNEEKLVEFKSIQASFKDYITKSFDLYKSGHLSNQCSESYPDILIGEKYLIEYKTFPWLKKKNYLDDYCDVFINFDAAYNHQEVANKQIE